ncbi:MAG: hypothetical protein J6Q73_00065 [Bacteroidaceae bacterium]|nr:hypothetical protein [Bacteroidaceae bacterium]
MKKLLLVAVFLFASAAIFAGPIEKIKKLADRVEKDHKSFDDEDWNDVAEEYAKLEKEFKEKERTNAELKEFGRQKGRIKGFMTKKTLDKWGKKAEKYANELGGSIEGFFESVETLFEN